MAYSGDGGSFGEALIKAIADAAGVGPDGRFKSYDAVGWHAQISKLTSSPRGYAAAEAAGLSATARTLKGWLSQSIEPNKANRAKIAEAYERMARGPWPKDKVEGKEIAIRGVVKTGADERDRGAGDTSPMHIDGSAAGASWRRMSDAWAKGEIDAQDFEDWFVEDVMEADVGEGSEEWEFPGGAYTVSIG